MPAAMEDWCMGGSKEESGGTGGSGAETGVGKMNEMAPVAVVASKRQRRPSVRLGEIGDMKMSVSKSDGLSTVRWISPNFIPRKSQSGFVRGGGGKIPRTRPLANVTHRGEIGQVLGTQKVGSHDVVIASTDVIGDDDLEKEAEGASGLPSTSGRGSYGSVPGIGGSRKGKAGKRKRAQNVRSSTIIAKTIGVVALNRKAKELQKVGYVGSLGPVVSNVDVSEVPAEFAELSGTHVDMEEDSGAGRTQDGNDDENGDEEHTQNGDTEVLEDDGNEEDSSGRHDDDEPASPGVRDNQITNANGVLEVRDGFAVPKDDRDQCTSRLADGDKNVLLLRDISMNGRRSEGRAVRGWLNSLGLDKYGDLFEENEVDNEVLHLLTFEDLKEMGVVAVGARRKMYAAIQELRASSYLSR